MSDSIFGEPGSPDDRGRGRFLSLQPVAPLTRPFAVRDEVFSPYFWLPVGLPVLFFGSLVLVVVGTSTGELNPEVPGEVAIVIVLFGLILGWVDWEIRRRCWIQVTLDGFILTERGQSTTYHDESVLGLSLWRMNDLRVWSRRVVNLEWTTPSGPRVLRCNYVPPRGVNDPLGGFWNRLEKSLAARTLDHLDAGANLAGRGWHLDASGLHLGGDGDPVVALSEVEKAESLGGHLLLWRAQEESAFWRVDLRTRNSGVLARILRRKVRRPAPALSGRPLGRVLLVRQGWVRHLYVGCLFVIAGALAVPFCLSVRLDNRDNFPLLMLVLYALAACVGLFFLWFYRRRRTITFHEHGITQPTAGGCKSLLYSELSSITYNRKGRITFQSEHDGGKTIRYANIANSHDPDIDRLLRTPVENMADIWEEQWNQGSLQWTDQLRFLPGALECRQSRSSPAEPLRIAYRRLQWRLSGERLVLSEQGISRPLFRARISVPNFHVGLALLERILADNEMGSLSN